MPGALCRRAVCGRVQGFGALLSQGLRQRHQRDLKMLGSIAKVIPEHMYVGRGCSKCNNGYKGRKGIFEIFEVDDTIQRLIFDHAPSSVLRQRAREMGMRTLREDGMLKVASGMTSLREVLQATMGDAD